MPRTLLIGHPGVSWRAWLKAESKDADVICLDPADPDQAPPARLTMRRSGKLRGWRFFGSLAAQRTPHVVVSALDEFLTAAGDDSIVQLFPYAPSPTLRQLTMLAAQAFKPDRILIAAGTDIDQAGFPVGPEEVELDAAFPALVQSAQRKAHWMKFIERCTEQVVPLDRVTLEGSRLGSGRKVDRKVLDKLGLPGFYAEVCGPSILLVGDQDPDEGMVARLLDETNTSRVVAAAPGRYRDLLVSFAKQSGEDFAMGLIQLIGFESGLMTVLTDAVPPASVKIVRVGSLTVDRKGNERGEVKPWQV